MILRGGSDGYAAYEPVCNLCKGRQERGARRRILGGNDESPVNLHFLKINLEACEELFRQISVRNLSGIIIIDFIDMKSKENNEVLMNKLKELASLDSVKTSIVDMTALGLVEITRKKVYKPLHEIFNNAI